MASSFETSSSGGNGVSSWWDVMSINGGRGDEGAAASRSRIVLASWHDECIHLWLAILAGGAFGGNRGLRPVPPEKGVFPLDHMHECDLVLLPWFSQERDPRILYHLGMFDQQSGVFSTFFLFLF